MSVVRAGNDWTTHVDIEGNPYDLVNAGGNWCIVKHGTREKVPGGCHGRDRDKALTHFRALETAYSKEQK